MPSSQTSLYKTFYKLRAPSGAKSAPLSHRVVLHPGTRLKQEKERHATRTNRRTTPWCELNGDRLTQKKLRLLFHHATLPGLIHAAAMISTTRHPLRVKYRKQSGEQRTTQRTETVFERKFKISPRRVSYCEKNTRRIDFGKELRHTLIFQCFKRMARSRKVHRRAKRLLRG